MRSPYQVSVDWLLSWQWVAVLAVLALASLAVCVWAVQEERAGARRCEAAGGLVIEGVCVSAPGLRRIHP